MIKIILKYCTKPPKIRLTRSTMNSTKIKIIMHYKTINHLLCKIKYTHNANQFIFKKNSKSLNTHLWLKYD